MTEAVNMTGSLTRTPPPTHDHTDDWIVCLTVVLSHVTMGPTLVYLIKKGWHFECFITVFSIMTSFLYHSCQAFHTTFILNEGHWHRLDNIGAITAFAIFYIHLATIENGSLDAALKYFAFFVAIICQEKAPWEIEYTVGPIILFGCVPIVNHCFIRRKWPTWDRKEFLVGHTLMAIAIPFFIWGLDDQNDPFKIYHGCWHLFAGLASLRLWRIVPRHPLHPESKKEVTTRMML